MDLLTYNKDYLWATQGLHNTGNICYFNSMMQCLLSCPSFWETLDGIRDKPHIQKNSLMREFVKVLDLLKNGQSIYDKCLNISNQIIAIAQKRNDIYKMNHGQEDMNEGLCMLFDTLTLVPELERLFMYRQRTLIRCGKCGHETNIPEMNSILTVQHDLKIEQHETFKDDDEQYGKSITFDQFIKKQNSYIDGDHKCSKCELRGMKFQSVRLSMVPEILVTVIKKYDAKTATPFPNELVFNCTDGKTQMTYGLVAQSEHAGSRASGHYWAICLRKENNNLVWKRLNDGSVSDDTPGPTKTSYVLFYHFMGKKSL